MAVMNFVTLPMFFLSGAISAAERAPGMAVSNDEVRPADLRGRSATPGGVRARAGQRRGRARAQRRCEVGALDGAHRPIGVELAAVVAIGGDLLTAAIRLRRRSRSRWLFVGVVVALFVLDAISYAYGRIGIRQGRCPR